MTPNFTKFNWATFSDASEPYQVRASKSVQYIDWDALCIIAKDVRNMPCAIGDQYGFGGRHVVREVVFDDNVRWIARVGIPAVNMNKDEHYIPTPLRHTWTTFEAIEMQSEVDTMLFVRQNTDIPVPDIFAFDCTCTNAVGASYMLMECIMGTCVVDVQSDHHVPVQYKDKYFTAEASVLVKLWDLKFDKIGCIFNNPETGTFEIGPLPGGLGGPYQTATEYYRAWAARNIARREDGSDFVSRIEEVSSLISKHDNGPFHLIHGDFSQHNILVDDDFNMLAVIDWEKSFVGPSEMAARFPMSLQVYPESIFPLHRDDDGRIIGDLREILEDRERYVAAVASHESQTGNNPRLSSSMVGCRAQEDILYLIRRWEDRTPWMYKYPPGIKEGINVIVERLRDKGFHKKE